MHLSGNHRAAREYKVFGLSRSRAGILLALIIAGGILLRMAVAAQVFTSTVDTATVGVMALNILRGEHTWFYYGQSYMGSLEAYVTAFFFALFNPSLFTLCLATIIFSALWTALSYALFSELFDRRAGLAAALLTSFPGWYTLWYTAVPYGGYPQTYAFGTLFLWLSLRWTRNSRWSLVLLLGIAGAAGVWTNLQIVSYLAAGMALMAFAILIRRHVPRLRGLCALAVVCVLTATGLIPFILNNWGLPRAESLLMGEWRPGSALANLVSVCLNELPHLILNTRGTFVARLLVLTPIIVLLPLSLYALRGRTPETWLPAIHILAFLAIYPLHPLASLGAPRYAIPLLYMIQALIVTALVTHEKRLLRRLGFALLAVTITLQTTQNIIEIHNRGREREGKVAARHAVVEASKRATVDHVMLIGSSVEGLDALIYRFYSRNEVVFTAPRDERYYPDYRKTERDPDRGYLVLGGHHNLVIDSLRALGIENYSIDAAGPVGFLLHDIYGVPPAGKVCLPGDLVLNIRNARGDSDSLSDRTWGTVVESIEGQPLTIEFSFNEATPVTGFRFHGPDPAALPNRYTLEVSDDGVDYRLILQINRRIGATAVFGDSVYFMGGFTQNETRFPPVTARHWRLRIECDGRPRIIDEMFVFRASEERPAFDWAALRRRIAAIDPVFIIADSRLSAELEAELGLDRRRPRVFPAPNDRLPWTMPPRRFTDLRDTVIAVEQALEKDALRTLAIASGSDHAFRTEHIGGYTLIIPVDGPLKIPVRWQDSTVLLDP